MKASIWRNAALCAAFLTGTTMLAQWTFRLDTTFRTQILDQNVNSLILLGDGKILVSGRVRFQGDMSVRGSARLNSDGARDVTFNDFNGQGRLTPWNDKFYVAIGATVRRLQGDGYLDPSFIGMNTGLYFTSSSGGDYHVFPDGRVLLSGSHTLSDSIRGFEGQYNLIWFSNTGYLDTTRTHRRANGTIWEFKELPDGKFICTCSCTQYEGQPVSRLFRIHADGSLDTTFNAEVSWGNIFAYHPLPDGRVYVGGRYKRAAAPNDTLYLARFLPDGSLDATFNHLNTLSTLPGITGAPKVLRLYDWLDGRLFVTGVYQRVNGEPRGAICVVDSTGALTPHMDTCMPSAFSYQGSTNAAVVEMLPMPDGSGYYICGTYAGYTDGIINDTQQRFVSRLLVSELSVGGASQSLGEGPRMRVFPNPVASGAPLTFAFDPPQEFTPNGPLRVVVLDALGRQVHEERVQLGSRQLANLPAGQAGLQLATGVYHLHLTDNTHWLAGANFVVE
jgi:uncharacterized delta-60 repeat protein